MLPIVLSPEELATLRRIETLAELPSGCIRATSRGIRSIFYRWGCALLRIDAGELTAVWILRPWNVPLRFDDKLPNGFGVASATARDCAVSVLGQPIKPIESHVHSALAQLIAEVSGAWMEPCEREQSKLDIARESVAMWSMERHRVGPRVERHELGVAVEEPPRKHANKHHRSRS